MKALETKRILSLLLIVALLLGFAVPVQAVSSHRRIIAEQVDNSNVPTSLLTVIPENETPGEAYADTDIVRVSIVLESKSTIEAGYASQDIAQNAEAMAYRADLQKQQTAVIAAIERKAGQKLDVVWNLTLAANIISANVAYGQIKSIEQIDGVKEVLIETQYMPDVVSKEETVSPNMANSGKQIGSSIAWNAGYTGAGTRIAVIDTGTDINHQSFDSAAFDYALSLKAKEIGMTTEAYLKELDLLDEEEIRAVASRLNADVDAGSAWFSTKLPFGYNYIDGDYDITHINDNQGEHGSHVAGISTANSYIPDGTGSFVRALDSVLVQGVAPEAQLLTMKVFGKNGGAYDSDYMAAIEDAVILGCDAVNLSLGSGNPGSSRNTTAAYQAILESLVNSGTVVTMSAGNSGSWVENAYNVGYLYAEDVSMQTNGSPGSFTNSLAVASVDNDGITGAYVTVGGNMIVYNETDYSNAPFTTIAGEHEYVFINAIGTPEQFAAVSDVLKGKIALCYRGETSFFQKAVAAVDAGAIATFIVNNQAGIINMDLTDYPYTQPVASISQLDGETIKTTSEAVTDDAGNLLYYTGTMTVGSGVGAGQFESEYYTMSAFSSWGVPGSLELKPEITAPGGSIYSVFGQIPDDGGYDKYELMSGTSMAAPQVAGMAAIVAQYIRENDLEEKTGLDTRTLGQSLLMSTAVPLFESAGAYYPVLRQGAGLGNVGAAVTADSYILMDENATKAYADGKVKAELGDDPNRTGEYTFSFNIHNMTGAEKSFALSADFFVQRLISDGVNMYMNTTTMLIGADVTWEVNGTAVEPANNLDGLDFNADGVVNAADGQTLLDYVTGVSTNLNARELADLDADGDIDTYDAYLFLSQLTGGTAVVPANGSAKVTVKAVLPADWKETIDNYYPNGTYIQGYVYAKSLSSAEGVEGTSHSIPVLAFYGNWTDPSMFDVGSYQQYATGEESRMPYLGNPEANSFAIVYADRADTYYFGGNPVVPDETYLPERNAINAEKGDMISKASFVSIRNAAASRFTVVNTTTGETLVEAFPGKVDSAYYYVNGAQWRNTGYSLNTNFNPSGIAEGSKLELKLTLAPEYYVDAEGNVAWDKMGDGASMSVPMVVDNSAPELEGLSLDMLNNRFVVQASDNQYVAAVLLTNKAGNRVYAYAGAKSDIQPGETGEYALDLEGIHGNKFMIQVVDYAMNATTYLVENQFGEPQPLPEFIAFDLDENHWTTFTRTSTQNDLEEYAPSDIRVFAATIIDHIVLIATEDGMLYAAPEEDLTDLALVGDMNTVIADMAYNPADGKVYGIDELSRLVTIDKLTAEVTVVGTPGVVTNTLACDEDGTFYCNGYGYQTIYTFTLDTMQEPELLVEKLDSYSKYVQSMEWNPNDGKLYYASFYSLTSSNSWFYEIDVNTGEFTKYNNLVHELSALIIPSASAGGEDWREPTDQVTGIQFGPGELTMMKGGRVTLPAIVQPWTAIDRTVTWTTSDPAVATVDPNGTVVAIDVGVATITATSNLDPRVSASCVVTVEKLDATIHGTLQDADGNPMFYSWNAATDTTWSAGKAIDTNMASATVDTLNNKVYIADANAGSWALHLVNPETGISEKVLTNGMQVPLTDIAYSTYFSTAEVPRLHTIFYYVYVPGQNPEAFDGYGFDMSAYMAIYSGGTELVAIASMGYESYYYADYGISFDTEHVVMLDNAGYIWHFYTFPDGVGGYTGIIEYTATDLDIDFPGDSSGSFKYSSMVAGDDGNLYLSAFTGKTNELFRLSYDGDKGMYKADRIGDVGQDVWPATITSVVSNATGEGNQDRPHDPIAMVSATAYTDQELWKIASTGGHTQVETWNGDNVQRPSSKAETDPETQTVTVDITASEAVTNGLAVVTWDTTDLALEHALISGTYTAKVEEDGKLTFGYVSLTEISADDTIATLTFRLVGDRDTAITIEHKQLNNGTGSTEKLYLECQHENAELRGVLDATCDTDGYTGDVYCPDCDKVIDEGEVIPATGHDFGAWFITTEPTCFANGEETRVCAICGGTETRVIDKSGENCPSEAFSDLNPDQWYHEAVDYVLRHGLMNGVAADTFAPNGTLTRAQLVTILYRLEGEPSVEGLANPFTDVAEGQWYTDAIIWAADAGVVNGVTKTVFNPNGAITREQIATILYRYAGSEKVEDNCLADFADAGKVSAYAIDAMNWAVANGLIIGMDETTLAPTATATRAQIATILMRFCGR